MVRASLVFVAAVCFIQVCQSQDVQVNGQSVQPRFLGGLNRYYVHYWDEGANGTRYTYLDNTQTAIDELDLIEATQTVAIVIHGRNDASFSDFTNTLVNSFIYSDKSVAVIVVDWSLVANLDYTTLFNSVPFVADDIISLISRMVTEIKINTQLVHIVGFDIGAHIAGIVSRDPRARVKKITGLSPAGEKWDANSRRLRATDADYVEVVHSDYLGVRALGIADQIGTVDLYLNTGTSQPGCSNNQCNHDRAWHVFAATLDTGGHLVGLRCETLADMTRNRCTGFPAVMLGTNALNKAGEGIYRVNTGRVYPFNV
ncbi:phospholipase A1-like [Choristoneura fumiferana]|uniref:phospholipase A1-like n=1 Tax=Choristoneura fumiferana TaxID=7141 RepID=UPI003D153D70